MAFPYDNNMPLGAQALDNRPPWLKAMDYGLKAWGWVPGGLHGWYAIQTRAHARLITQGAYRHGPGAGYGRTMDKYIGQGMAGGRDTFFAHLKGEGVSKVHPWGWYKAGSVNAFDPERKSLFHSFMYKGNKDKGELNAAARKVSAILDTGKLGEKLKNVGILNKQGELSRMFDPEVSARYSAANTWDRLAKKDAERLMSPEHAANLRAYLGGSNPALVRNLDDFAKVGGNTIEDFTYRDAARFTRMAMIRPVSAGMAGYFEGVKYGEQALDPILAGTSERAAAGFARGQVDRQLLSNWRDLGSIAKTAPEELAARGLESVAGKSATTLGMRAIAAAGVEVAGAASELGLNPILDAMAAYSVVKLGAQLVTGAVKGVAHFAEGGVNSFMGDINKPVGGMGYRPTLAATTSRARGVMAIQNSQINARSVLGSEAGAVYQHFG